MTNQCEHGQLARVCELCEKNAEMHQLRQYLDAAQRRGEDLRAQVAALEVDAGRYRWLRDKARSVDWTENINGWSWTQHCRIGGLSMDAAIDAALAARKGAA